MVAKLGVFVIVPSNSSVLRCRPFLSGVPRDGSPASTVLLRHSDSPSLVLASLRFLVRRYPGPDRSRPPRKQQGLPGSWGSLVCMPCSRTPVDLRAGPLRVFALQHFGVAFRCWYDVGSTTIFRGSITRPTHSLSTLRSQGRPLDHARLASGWGPALTGRATRLSRPAGIHRKVSAQLITSSLPRRRAARHVVLHFLAHTSGLFGGVLALQRPPVLSEWALAWRQGRPSWQGRRRSARRPRRARHRPS